MSEAEPSGGADERTVTDDTSRDEARGEEAREDAVADPGVASLTDVLDPPINDPPINDPPIIDLDAVVDTTADAAPEPPLNEPTGVVSDAQFVGRWRISGSSTPRSGGGAIGWMREYELRANHTFQMNAYPSLTLGGTWRRVGTRGARAVLVHRDMRRPDGTRSRTAVRGLAEAGQRLRVLEIEGQRFPRAAP